MTVLSDLQDQAHTVAEHCEDAAEALRREAAERDDIDDPTRARKVAAADQVDRYAADLRHDAVHGVDLDTDRLRQAHVVARAASLSGILMDPAAATTGLTTSDDNADRAAMAALARDGVFTRVAPPTGRPFYALSAYAPPATANELDQAAELGDRAQGDTAERDVAQTAHDQAQDVAEPTDEDAL
jgi:hypothetical protein